MFDSEDIFVMSIHDDLKAVFADTYSRTLLSLSEAACPRFDGLTVRVPAHDVDFEIELLSNCWREKTSRAVEEPRRLPTP